MSKTKSCAHIKVTGVRCGCPALREAEFCYFHQRMLRTVKGPKSRIHPIALLENAAAIQSSVMEVVNGLIRGTIDLKRGELILRALNIATRNSKRAHFGVNTTDMVTQIPEYSEPEDPTPTVAEMYAKAMATAAAQVAPTAPIETAASTAAAETAAIDPTQRKPPASAKEAPKERKIAVHRASGG